MPIRASPFLVGVGGSSKFYDGYESIRRAAEEHPAGQDRKPPPGAELEAGRADEERGKWPGGRTRPMHPHLLGD